MKNLIASFYQNPINLGKTVITADYIEMLCVLLSTVNI